MFSFYSQLSGENKKDRPFFLFTVQTIMKAQNLLIVTAVICVSLIFVGLVGSTLPSPTSAPIGPSGNIFKAANKSRKNHTKKHIISENFAPPISSRKRALHKQKKKIERMRKR